MPIVNVDNLDQVGIIADLPPDELPINAWTDGQNVRMRNGAVEKFLGAELVWGTPLFSPQFLMPWQTPTDYRWIYASGTKIGYTDGLVHYDITRYTTTPGDNDYTGYVWPIWTGAVFNGVPVMNHDAQSDYPQQWDSTLVRMRDLDAWPVGTYTKVIRSYGNFLVALGIRRGGADYPYLVKWSHPADPGTVPASWDPADPTKLAGEHVLAQTGGHLVDCLPLGAANVVYKEDAIWLMQLVGGQYVFSWKEVSQTTGALAPYCMREFFGKHFVVGMDDIYLFDGVRPQSLIARKLRKWFFAQLDSNYFKHTMVIPNFAQQEIWVCYIASGAPSGQLTQALVWNWNTNAWTIKELEDLAFVQYGQVNTGIVSFDGDTGTFDSASGPFGDAGISPASLQLLSGRSYGGNALVHLDEGYVKSDSTPFVSYIERQALALSPGTSGSPTTDPATVKFVRRIFPKVDAPTGTTLRVSVGVQDTPGGPITWAGPQDFVVGRDSYLDMALQGRYLAVRFEDNGSTPWTLRGYALDLDVVARV